MKRPPLRLDAVEEADIRGEGVMRQSDWVDGRWADVVMYGILEDEFRRP